MGIKRYHTVGYGLGIGGSRFECDTSEPYGGNHMKTMYPSNDDCSGTWVRYDEHTEVLSSERAAAYALGYEDGKAHVIHAQDKVKTSWHDYADQPFAGIAHAYIAPVESDESKRTKQLLNELFHNRATLERALKDAVDVVATVEEYLMHGDNAETSDFVIGMIRQFIDTHGE